MTFASLCSNFWRRSGLILRACLQKEGIAFVALLVSLTGAGILSFMLWGNLLYFRRHGATDQLFYLSCGMLFLIGMVFMSSHRLLGSKQAIEAEFWRLKFKLNQGESDDDPPPKVPVM